MDRSHAAGKRALRVLIVVENMSYTFDTRVRNIAHTLERNGCRVWVICPRYPGDPPRRVEGEVSIYFYPVPPLPGGFVGHVLEYVYSFACIGFATGVALARVRFDVIHICNPPDIFFPIGWLCRLLGRRFVFDLHDLCPELWQVRYRESRLMHRVLLALERATLRAANHVLTTSETARERICHRAGIRRSHVTLVRNGPDLANFPAPAQFDAHDTELEVGYIGDMNPQDGIDHLLRAAHLIHHGMDRTDIRFVLIGDGSASERLRRQVDALGLGECVQFTGRLRPREAMRRLAACTLCVQPDLKNPFNDACVMVKSLEYMALGKPLVAFDLNETRRICGEAALYATRNDPQELATAILALADDPSLRRKLGEHGRRRVEEGLAWSFSERQLLGAYARLRRERRMRPRAFGKLARRLRRYWHRLLAMPSSTGARAADRRRTFL
jgi:glycosyltransferase involved in cell wall biosynthesis